MVEETRNEQQPVSPSDSVEEQNSPAQTAPSPELAGQSAVEPKVEPAQDSEVKATEPTPAPAASDDQFDDEHFPEDDEMHEELDPEMVAMYEDSLEQPKPGEIVRAVILSITNEDVMVGFGGKSEVMIPLKEFELDQPIANGQEYELVFKGSRGGRFNMSRIEARTRVGLDRIRAAFESGEPLPTKAVRRTKGGLKVVTEGIEGFMPFSHSGVRRGQEAAIEALVGQTFPAVVVELPEERKNMVLSRRMYIEKQAASQREAAMSKLEVGKRVVGKVKHMTSFGAFLDLGGVDGLLHVKDMSHGHVAQAEDMVQLGQELEVVILSIEGDKIALGLKQIQPDPWDNIEEKYPVGGQFKGKIISLTKYGAFVELVPGVEGLVHISEMSWTKRLRHPSEMWKEGEEIDVLILSVDSDNRKISLGHKQIKEDPWQQVVRDHPEDSIVQGRVVSLTNYGVFVQLAEGVDGMIHVSDLVWGKKVNQPSDVLKEGDLVEARVLKIDNENRKIQLGMKQVHSDPWTTAEKSLREGQVVEAKINNITDFGAFAEVLPGVDGLIHVSEISSDRVEKPSDALSVGQVVTAKVTRLDVANQKIGLSMRAMEESSKPSAAVTESVRSVQPDIPMETEPEEMISDFGEILKNAVEEKQREQNAD